MLIYFKLHEKNHVITLILIICMKKFGMVKQKKRMRITQSGKNCVIKLRHPRRVLDLKAKDLIGSLKNRIVYQPIITQNFHV